ncbi:hypothetical protein EZV62_007590 [Acer yangbiense]|uniref:Uncharacterized protein n=1 Tax=Acer yangbiense TaxID=1000413 RepID=A0A5C7IAP6_9ROSI|nr:hypothetical protein EZV62_007590 [Acer yangbiense]
MVESETVKLYENLLLVDEDGAIHEMSEEAQRDGEADVDLCLVGKILSGKKAIWGNRNSLYNSGKGKISELVVSGAMSLLSEFQKSKSVLSTQISPGASRSCPDWLAPPPSRLKLNMVVALRKNVKFIGIGAAIRDAKGLVLAARSN